MHKTSTEKETPKPVTWQSAKGAVPSKGEAAVSGGVVGTEHREVQRDQVRGGWLTPEHQGIFPVCRFEYHEDFSARSGRIGLTGVPMQATTEDN